MSDLDLKSDSSLTNSTLKLDVKTLKLHGSVRVCVVFNSHCVFYNVAKHKN